MVDLFQNYGIKCITMERSITTTFLYAADSSYFRVAMDDTFAAAVACASFAVAIMDACRAFLGPWGMDVAVAGSAALADCAAAADFAGSLRHGAVTEPDERSVATRRSSTGSATSDRQPAAMATAKGMAKAAVIAIIAGTFAFDS